VRLPRHHIHDVSIYGERQHGIGVKVVKSALDRCAMLPIILSASPRSSPQNRQAKEYFRTSPRPKRAAAAQPDRLSA